VLLASCDRGVRPSKLGHVIYADPEVPGSRDPYPLPQLDEDAAAAGAAKDAKPSAAKSPAAKPQAVTTRAADTSGDKSQDAKQALPSPSP